MGHLITGSSGTPHITPKSDSVWHRGMMGVESCILDYGEKLAPALIPSQPTNIRILDGCGMMQGRFFEIEEGSYDTIAIPNGAQNYNRIDLVCAKITQNENGTQTFSWEVVQGTQTSGTPQPPTVAEHSLDDGDEFALMPIASVELEGVSIVAVETVAEIGRTVSDDIRKVVPLRENEFIEVKELLWTNPNPSSAFATQTVSLDLSEYDAVEIVFAYSTGALTDTDTKKAHIGNGARVLFGVALSESGNPYIMSRGFTVANGGVLFGTPYRKQQNANTSATTINTDAIPLKIYGIKHI